MIRHGAQLAFAYARATVPRVAVALRKAYGGAYIVMDSRYMGNDYYLAWPTAEIAVMGAKGAVEILHRQAGDDERAGLVRDYEERLLNPYEAAERGSVDAIIDPAETRREVAAAFDLLASKQEKLPTPPPRQHPPLTRRLAFCRPDGADTAPSGRQIQDGGAIRARRPRRRSTVSTGVSTPSTSWRPGSSSSITTRSGSVAGDRSTTPAQVAAVIVPHQPHGVADRAPA